MAYLHYIMLEFAGSRQFVREIFFKTPSVNPAVTGYTWLYSELEKVRKVPWLHCRI